jgi:uncharacterized surface protein with fasciclin (FAS1) repeats
MRATRPAKAANPSNGGPASAEPSREASQRTVTPGSPYRAEKRRGERNLVETAAIMGSFTTLAAAARTAGVVDMLSEQGPFTMFAPTDAAFSKLPTAERNALLKDKARLTQVLTYHVVPGIVKAPKAGSPRAATTLNGAELTITATDGGFTVNDARVVRTEIVASNGVIHAIDTVLVPR